MKENKTLRRIGDWYNDQKKALLPIIMASCILSFAADLIAKEQNRPKEVTYREYINTLELGRDQYLNGVLVNEIPDVIDTVYYSTDSDEWRYTLWNEKSRKEYQEWIDAGKEPAKFEYNYKKEDWRVFEMPDFTNDTLQAHVEEYSGISCRQIIKKEFTPFYIRMLPMFGSTLLTLGFMLGFFGVYAKKMNGMDGFDHDLLVKETNKKFSDVIGQDEAVEDLKLIVRLMQASKEKVENDKKKLPLVGDKKETAMDLFDANIPKGMLLYGPPGTGKTLMAKAIAGEASVSFVQLNASEFIDRFVGVGARRVRKGFEEARKNAPCIVFIDEIDAIGTSRDNMNQESRQTINALLQEMDGFSTKGNVFVIAATNTPQSLDSALVRSGRFDRQVYIGPPRDWKTRKQMFELYLKKQIERNACNADLERISKECIGFTGADINAVCNEACLIAIAQGAEAITTDIMEEAVDKKLFNGNRIKKDKAREGLKEEAKVIAHHEAGHALVRYLKGLPIARATIIGNTAGAGGAVISGDSQKELVSKTDLISNIMSGFGGRAAEELIFGKENITTGALCDFRQITESLKQYVTMYGFDDIYGPISGEVLYNGNKEDKTLNERVHSLAKNFYLATVDLLTNNKDKLVKLAEELLAKESLSEDEIKEILK